MEAILKRIEAWFSEHLPEVLADLNPGARIGEIGSLETKIGVELPNSLRKFYQWRDGQQSELEAGFFYGLEWLSLEGIYLEWKTWSELFDEGFAEMEGEWESFHRGKIKEVYINKQWIPFASDGGGNHLAIDLDPGPQGTVGQIINFGSDEDTKYVLAEDFESFLSWFITQLESGNYTVYEDSDIGKVFHILNPNLKHFLDAVRVVFQ